VANDLANLLGDYSRPSPVALPRNLAVNVIRRGEQVLLAIGNADPIRLSHAPAASLGERLLKEGHAAKRRGEDVEIGFGHHKLVVNGRAAIKIGQRLRDRAAEIRVMVNGVFGIGGGRIK